MGNNNNIFVGENITYYDSLTSTIPLDDEFIFVDGDFYYITQTIDGCESIERLEFQFLAPEPTITVDDSVLCLGQSTTVSVSATPAVGTVSYIWNSDENLTSESINISPNESGNGWVDLLYNGALCRYFYSLKS